MRNQREHQVLDRDAVPQLKLRGAVEAGGKCHRAAQAFARVHREHGDGRVHQQVDRAVDVLRQQVHGQALRPERIRHLLLEGAPEHLVAALVCCRLQVQVLAVVSEGGATEEQHNRPLLHAPRQLTELERNLRLFERH
jgi:hypothetical protein